MSKEKKVKLLIEVDEDLYNKCLEIKDFTIVKAAIAIGNGIPITDDCISREWVIHNVLSLIDPETRYYVEQVIDSAPTLELNSEYGAIQYSNGFNDGFTVAKDTIIQNIAKQYIEHSELVPIWLSIGNIKGGEVNATIR